MKRITSTVLGFTLASAGMVFAAQTTPAPAPADNSAPVAKKHVKKNKKAKAATQNTTTAPAPVSGGTAPASK